MAHEHVIIRPARISDIPSLPAIERSAALLFSEIPGYEIMQHAQVIDQVTHTRWMRDGFYLVAEHDFGRRIGFLAALRCGPGQLVIPAIAVRRAFQRRGLGRAMLERCIEDARQRGIEAVWVQAELALPWTRLLGSLTKFDPAGVEHVPAGLDRINQDNPRVATWAGRQQIWMRCCLRLPDSPDPAEVAKQG